MFNSDNRWFHLYIPFDAETVLMAVLWLCLLIVVFHFFRKRTKLIQNFGVTTLLLLLGLVLVRLFMPIQLNYSKDIPSVLLGRISSFFCDTQLFVLPGLSVGVTPAAPGFGGVAGGDCNFFGSVSLVHQKVFEGLFGNHPGSVAGGN